MARCPKQRKKAIIVAVSMAVLKLHSLLLRKPKPVLENSDDPKWKHFKNCIGALDGKIINVRATKENQERYRTRKETIGMIVLGAESMKPYLVDWEGSAHDGRVLRDTFIRPNGLKVAKGFYYLCDAGYSNCEGVVQCRGVVTRSSDEDRIAQLYYQLPTNEERLCFLLRLIN
ncbi:unnamed protein product [Linum trigynum]|uniref:DDE Tnp4 domain-containing protein n=1 Tax=Linum trigynum TaxID=586398 RepID=A0AAV2EWJ7_9ROSI